MLTQTRQTLHRTDIFASLCESRQKSTIPLGLFFFLDSVTGNFIMRILQTNHLTPLPALTALLFSAYCFQAKARQTYKTHHLSIDLKTEKEKLIDDSKDIIRKLLENKPKTTNFLAEFKLSPIQQDTLLTFNSNHENDFIRLYKIHHEIYQSIHPHKVNYKHTISHAALHGITYFTEYMLLKYFAKVDILEFGESPLYNFLACIMIFTSLIATLQAIAFDLREKKPSSDILRDSIRDHYRLFKSNNEDKTLEGVSKNAGVTKEINKLKPKKTQYITAQNEENGITSINTDTVIDINETTRLLPTTTDNDIDNYVLELASYNSTQKCAWSLKH